jgi:hypothetical protein
MVHVVTLCFKGLTLSSGFSLYTSITLAVFIVELLKLLPLENKPDTS